MMLVTKNDELNALCQKLHLVEYITIDTEFIRESTFFPELCLIQIAGPDLAFAIDVLTEGLDLSPLFKLMQDKKVLKVFHSGRQDIEILFRLSEAIPEPIFDTQIAAMVCGFGESVAYETLVSQLIHKKLDKSQRVSDWKMRPLTEKQIEYALGDVVYLREVYVKLKERLARNNRTEWLQEELETLCDPKLYKPQPEEAWKKLKSKKTDAFTLCVLKELAAWRDIKARERNIPRKHFLSDDVLLELAYHKPQSIENLKLGRFYPRSFYKTDIAQEALAVIEASSLIPEKLWPTKEPSPEMVGFASSALDVLKLALKIISEKEGVAPKLLATTDDLKHLIRKDYKSDTEIPLLHGWRHQIFGKTALDLLEGKLKVYLQNNQIIIG